MKTARMLLILVLAFGLAAEVANADFTFGTPTNLGPIVNTSSGDWHPSISADGLSLYFNSNRPGGYGGYDLWVTTRETTDDPWGAAVNLGPTVNSSRDEVAPSISADGLSLYFSDPFNPRPGGYGSTDIWVTTRATTEDDWGTPVNLGPPVNTLADEIVSSISPDGLQLYFCDYQAQRPGGLGSFDLWVTTRATTDDDWGTPVNLGPKLSIVRLPR
jgi:Tol biopolymer transport system component